MSYWRENIAKKNFDAWKMYAKSLYEPTLVWKKPEGRGICIGREYGSMNGDHMQKLNAVSECGEIYPKKHL